MFKSKTVFIVGAGASCEANLPSGEELKDKIAKLLDIRFQDGFRQNGGDHQITAALQEHVRSLDGRQGDINPYLHKARTIRDALPLAISIDNFLEAHQGDVEIELCGKLAIVRSILAAESTSELRCMEVGREHFNKLKLRHSWYTGFFQMLTENVRKSEVEKLFDNVTIITFNYDRCIERFLVQALAEYYVLDFGEATKIAGQLTIIHPYGKVGNLPRQGGDNTVPFGSTAVQLLEISKQIRTFAEGESDKELMDAIHNSISTAETLVFLGFAFHPANMELLTPKAPTKVRRVFATTFGLSDADKRNITHDIWRMLGVWEQGNPLRPELASLKCGDFFQQYFRSISADNHHPAL
jgi:hypothetical protein